VKEPELSLTQKIIGRSQSVRDVLSVIKRVAEVDTPILITGPSGSGKELVAQAIHAESQRQNKAFIAKNCAAFTETLIEAELFGHVKGSFTGALSDRPGLFDVASGGTLFLDEIGEMSTPLQAKFLRVLQDGTYMPVGTSAERKVDVRVIAATNRDLKQLLSEGQFRQDLFYRLNVININLPALKDRRDDIPVLVEHFLSQFALKYRRQSVKISSCALGYFLGYNWPGNVRELRNEIERVVVLLGNRDVVDKALLSSHIVSSVDDLVSRTKNKSSSLRIEVQRIEKETILRTLEQEKWNKSSTARVLGISRSNLISKIKLFDLRQGPQN